LKNLFFNKISAKKSRKNNERLKMEPKNNLHLTTQNNSNTAGGPFLANSAVSGGGGFLNFLKLFLKFF